MTKTQKVELVRQYLDGITVDELAEKFGVKPAVVVYNLTNIYQRRRGGRKINAENCVHPGLANWLNNNGYPGSWLAERIGVSRQQMSYYLHGETRVTKRRRAQISRLLGVEESVLFAD